jgi:hypothetical protein
MSGYRLRTGILGLMFLTGERWGRRQYAGKVKDADASNDEVYVYLDFCDDYGYATYRDGSSFAVWNEPNKRFQIGDAYLQLNPVSGDREAWLMIVLDTEPTPSESDDQP